MIRASVTVSTSGQKGRTRHPLPHSTTITGCLGCIEQSSSDCWDPSEEGVVLFSRMVGKTNM